MRSKKIEQKKKNLKLTKRQKEIVIGTLLGDGSLETQNQGKTWRLKIEHSLKQKEYVDWFYRELKEFVLTPPRIINKNGRLSYGFSTLSVGNFRFFGFQFYDKEGKKKLPKIIRKFLTPLVLSVWFMDDGSRKSNKHRTYIIHSLGFQKKDLEEVQELLKEKYDIETKLHIQRKYKEDRWRLYVVSNSAERFKELIQPYLLPIFYYKLA